MPIWHKGNVFQAAFYFLIISSICKYTNVCTAWQQHIFYVQLDDLTVTQVNRDQILACITWQMFCDA